MRNNRLSFFKHFTKSETDIILKNCVEMDFEANDIIFKKGSKKFSGAIIINEGAIDCFDDKSDLPINGFSKDEYFNFSSNLFSNEREFTAVAKEKTKILFIDKLKINDLSKDDDEIGKIFERLSVEEYNCNKLFGIFRDLYGESLDCEAHKKIYRAGEWVFLEDNSKLFEINDKSDSFCFLVTGLLKAFIPHKETLVEVGEIYEGEVIGEMGIISNEPRSASIFATRDSVVFKINIDVANKLIMRYPQILLEVATKIADRLRNVQIPNPRKRTDIFSLVQLTKGISSTENVKQIARSLTKSINQNNSCIFLTTEIVNDMLNIDDINKELEKDKFYPPLDDLIEKLSSDNRFIFVCCSEEYSNWTFWCLSISDKNLLIVDDSKGITNSDLLYHMNEHDKNIPTYLHDERRLIICHHSNEKHPVNTAKIIDQVPTITQHFHMVPNSTADAERVSRVIIKKGVGICLSGGGARGNAHIGVYKALVENEIPVDLVCGTSAGGIVASLIAFGYSPDEIIERLKETYKRNSFKEYTLPVTSIIATRKVIEDAKWLGEDRDVEDLWIPYFSVAVDISKSKLKVIDRGPVYQATRATAALPGILLPVIKDSSFLVDGGLINNMPGDILKNKYGGKLVSVSVSPQDDLKADFKDFPKQSSYFFKKLLNMNKKFPHELPGFANILMRSIFVASSTKRKEVVDLSDLFFDLHVDGVGLLDFDSIDKSVELGYEFAMKKLENFDVESLKN